MARPKNNPELNQAIERITAALGKPGFREALWHIARQIPASVEAVHQLCDDRYRQVVPGDQLHYVGVYYQFRELCDDWGLSWPYEANCLLRLVSRKRWDRAFWLGDTRESTVRDAVDDRCPSPRDWQWFRMARTGLGWPREDELVEVREQTNGGRSRPGGAGMTISEIKDRAEVKEEKTVREAIKRCWDYLVAGHFNTAVIRERAQLTLDEEYKLVFTYDELIARRKRSR